MSPPGLVMLHGFLGDARDYAEVARRLRVTLASDAPSRCAAIDLPGHGPRPAAVDATTFEAGIDQVRRQVEAMGIDRCYLVGYSMGGRVALSLLARAPDLVAGVVAVGAHAGIEDPDARVRRLDADRETRE